MGFRVLILQSTFFDFVIKPKSWVHWASFEAVKDKVDTASFHIMSNGGARSFCCFEEHFRKQFKPLNVETLIIDSCPTLEPKSFPPLSFFVPWVPKLISKILDIILFPFVMLHHIWITMNPSSSIFYKQSNRILRQLQVPKLFLYSQADVVVPAADIEKAIDIAKLNGSKVEAIDFNDSSHVQHLRMHPVLYKTSIAGFFSRYLKYQLR